MGPSGDFLTGTTILLEYTIAPAVIGWLCRRAVWSQRPPGPMRAYLVKSDPEEEFDAISQAEAQLSELLSSKHFL